jgi:hypothetical protein
MSLSMSIYVTVLLAALSYVIAEVSSDHTTGLYAFTFLYTFGCMMVLGILFVPRLLNVNKANESSKNATVGTDVSISSKSSPGFQLIEDEVELKLSDSFFSLSFNQWKTTQVKISGMGVLHLGNGCAILLSRVILLNRVRQASFGMQLVDGDSSVWIKCKDEKQYTTWYTLLRSMCKQMDENIEENL